MDASQKSMVAGRITPLYEKEAAERQKALAGTRPNSNPNLSDYGREGSKGKTADIIGAMVGVSGRSVERASKVLKDGTEELVKAVDKGEISVRKAADIAKLPKESPLHAIARNLNTKIKYRCIIF